MKLIKIITAVVMSFGMMVAQPPTQGGNQDGNQDGNQGPPPCDEWLNSDMAHDMNDDGVVDEGDCPGAGPPPFQHVDTNGDGKIDREEARDKFGQDEDGNPDPEFDSRFDSRAGDDGLVDQAEYDQADQDGGQPPECDVCGYTFTGEGDHHGHCDRCDFVFISDNDQHGHCDQCDYIFSGEGDQHGHCDKCDHIWSGDPEDHHGHCDHEGCDFVGNTNEDWENHHHDDGGTGGPGGAPTNHWDGNCAAMCEGHGEYWLDSDGDGQPEDGPYATWDHDADGNPVDCGCGGGEGGPMAGDTCQFMDADGVQCSYVYTGTEADQDHHHN